MNHKKDTAAKDKLLKGFLKEPAERLTMQFSASHRFDRALFKQDIAVSLAHIKMLKSIGLLDDKEHEKLSNALLLTKDKIAKGKVEWRDELEDIHMHIESEITRQLGETGRKLHPGRSRNDQVATDIRLYLRDATDDLIDTIARLRQVLAERAEEYHAVLMPGFTHLQPAQPVTFGHHLMAWQEMLVRDQERLTDCRKRINQMPLGAAALAGTSFPVDRTLLAKELGFDAPMKNSLDAVSARDFAIEFAAATAICMQHLSRWSEELILWCSPQFGFVELPDHLCTGSSIMPQKKNPDLPELVRGKSGRVFGNLVALLTLMKGQPLAYNKDNQEDKEPLFDSVRTLKDCLKVWILLASGMCVNPARTEAALNLGHINATCLADYLTAKGMPFREAYAIAGKAVRQAIRKKKRLQELKPEQFRQLSELIEKDIYPQLDYANIVASYDLPGGSAPARVRQAARNTLLGLKKRATHRTPPNKT